MSSTCHRDDAIVKSVARLTLVDNRGRYCPTCQSCKNYGMKKKKINASIFLFFFSNVMIMAVIFFVQDAAHKKAPRALVWTPMVFVRVLPAAVASGFNSGGISIKPPEGDSMPGGRNWGGLPMGPTCWKPGICKTDRRHFKPHEAAKTAQRLWAGTAAVEGHFCVWKMHKWLTAFGCQVKINKWKQMFFFDFSMTIFLTFVC